ncbi:MAG TPA: molybdenum cofactor guanylyltransferase [Phototrophicaceae bacterium]|jgi:molybdopterin-guanine dinucleotide biosynthesis protein A|nr:molybdenum cofactor guanylyltransferase [Phototrophicaceae bacterium]
MTLPVSAVIQAGGRSTRMGTDKAFVMLNGKPLIAHVIERLRQINPAELIVISNQPHFPPETFASFIPPDLPVYSDLAGVAREQGPLGGILTALHYAQSDNVIVVGCDMPFINPRLLTYIIELQLTASASYRAIVPRWQGQYEGLHALYHRDCRSIIQHQLETGRLRLADLFSMVNTRVIDEAECAAFDPDGRSFININTPGELVVASSEL